MKTTSFEIEPFLGEDTTTVSLPDSCTTEKKSLSKKEPRESPLITLSKQTSLNSERITKNGKTKQVHVVVKNSPFSLSFASTRRVNFNDLSFEIKLLYDVDPEKEVSYVKTKPIEYKPMVNDIGDKINFDVKIKVLSSHHEDNLFRLKLSVWSVDTFPQTSVLSEPIKVISKPLKSRKKARTGIKRNASGATKASQNAAVNQDLTKSLQRIEQRQSEGLELLKQLMEQSANTSAPVNGGSPPISPPQLFLEALDSRRPNKKVKKEPNSGTDDANDEEKPHQVFNSSFSSMLQSFTSLDPEERAQSVRKLVRSFGVRDVQTLMEMFDLFKAQGLESEKIMQFDSQQHFTPMENFYSDVFF